MNVAKDILKHAPQLKRDLADALASLERARTRDEFTLGDLAKALRETADLATIIATLALIQEDRV